MTLKTPAEEVAEAFDLDVPPPPLPPRYNVAPSQDVAVLRARPEAGRLRRALEVLPWSPERVNARAETVFARPAFRDAARAARCAVVADGFYEWRAPFAAQRGSGSGPRQPYYIFLRGGRPFAIAAILGERGVTVLTTAANLRILPLHDRMPVILGSGALARWLDPTAERPELKPLLAPYPPEEMELHPVSLRVNRFEHDDPACCAPAPELRASSQGTLF